MDIRLGAGGYVFTHWSRPFPGWTFLLSPFSLPGHEVVADGEGVHAGAEEAVDGFFGGADDGLVFVEGGVEDDGDAGFFAEGGDEAVVARVDAGFDGLEAAGAVDVGDGGDDAPFFGEDVVDFEHEGVGVG